MYIVDIAIALSMLLIAYQDFRSRSIVVWLLVLPIPLLAIQGITGIGFTSWATNTLFNFAILLSQLLLLKLFYTFKSGKNITLADRLLGWGDIVFLSLISMAFSPINFIMFYVLGLSVVLLGFITYQAIAKNTNKNIPLAGGLALVYLFLYIPQWLLPDFNLYNNSMVYQIAIGL